MGFMDTRDPDHRVDTNVEGRGRSKPSQVKITIKRKGTDKTRLEKYIFNTLVVRTKIEHPFFIKSSGLDSIIATHEVNPSGLGWLTRQPLLK